MAVKAKEKVVQKAQVVTDAVEKTANATKQAVQDKVISTARSVANKSVAIKQAIQTKTVEQVKKTVAAAKQLASATKKVADDKVWCPLKKAWVNTDKIKTANMASDAVGILLDISANTLKLLPKIQQFSAFSRAVGVSKYNLKNAGKLMEKAAPWLTGLGVALTAAEKARDNAKALLHGSTRERFAAGTKVAVAGALSYGVGKLAGFAGAKVGALAGAKLGAALGSVVPGAGTIVGAVIGVAVGVAVGYAAGKLVEKHAEKPIDKGIDRLFGIKTNQPTRGP
jgi:hypothetical protein